MGLKMAHVLAEGGLGVTEGKGQAGSRQPTQASACTGCGGQKRLPLSPGAGRKELHSVPALGRRGRGEGRDLLKVLHFARRGSDLHGNPRGGSDALAAALQG